MERFYKSLPLSVAQTGMWVKEKFSPPDLSFTLAEAMDIHGPVVPELFCRALEQLGEEVEAIRSRIIETDGKPHQVVLPHPRSEFDVIDFSDDDHGREKARDWMQAELRRHLDLARDDLWFSALIKIADDHWIWYHRVHHILIDGFSGGLLARRVADIYTALKQGRVPDDFDFGSPEELLESENQYRKSIHFERDRFYWLEQMKDVSTPVTLARRDETPSGGLLRYRAIIPQADIATLQAEGKKMGASLPQSLIAMVAAYYARATDCEDLTIVTMVTGRISGAVRRIPGMVANAVPLRFKITTDLTWQDLVKQVSSQMMRALRYQRYRYEDLRRDLGFAGQDEQVARLGVNIEPFDYDLRFDGHPTTVHNLSNGTMTDFTIFAYDRGDGGDLTVDFDANPALYTFEELQEHQARFIHMLEAILKQPDKPISSVSLLSEDESRKILFDWNDTSHSIAETSWLDLFRQQVQRQPEAPAVIFEDRSLTYTELDQASDDWAAVLTGQGITTGHLVAVAMPRSEQMVVALLAVMKCGAAYLPLDPSDPGQRLAMILEDGRPSALLTTEAVSALLPPSDILCIMLDRADAGMERVSPPPAGPQASDTAYVIFTSGSTGRPKGVEISHGSLLNFLHSMQDLLKLTPADRIVAVTTIAFDIATLELYLPLATGAATVVATRDVVKDPEALQALIRKQSVSIMQATPSLWRLLLSEYPQTLTGLRPLVGGEALPRDLARMMERLGHPVMNLYGPTETTVWSTVMPLTGNDLDSVPIGRPIWNTQVYVLDRMRQPVPPGYTGELYIGGKGVAKGYLNKPDLTAERFLPNPFVGGEERIYRTGDLARWRSDGVLDYLGRNDHQIKIRGFRVEPGEIETALMAIEPVRQAVVVLREDPGKHKQLVAYLTSKPQQTIDTGLVAEHLAQAVPPQMIPAAFVVLDALPLNTNGKIDRNALPAPQWQLSEQHVMPRNETEATLASIWCDVLKIDIVSVHDNFFQLGGDSLAAAAMVSALRRKFDGTIPLAGFLEHPTIAHLAQHIDTKKNQPSRIAPVLPIRRQGNRAPLFCIHPVMGLGWAFTVLAQHIPEDIPIYALQADGLNDLAELPHSIEEMALRYLKRIKDIQPEGPYSLLGWSLGGLIAHDISRRLSENGEEITFLGLLDSYPFLPPTGPRFSDETVLAKAALGFLGFDEDSLGDRPALSRLGDFLYNEYGLAENIFIKQASDQDPDFLDRVQKTILHHLDLAQRYVPGRAVVDIHFFRAEPGSSDSVKTILNYNVDVWSMHIDGRLHIHDMSCSHQDMLETDHAAQIGAVFAHELLGDMVTRLTTDHDLRHVRMRGTAF
ncbi:amino acid adenylation domain-containing protein [Allorhizobium sp. BGMRC 0089]|uniref:amino acid adenylation domain-containing protein n=1 Tax=Allorhizobium sonneratiae TaxID=2934936 RepID=UPI00237C9E29|nr:amino acid adenylation domain-containing protein [Allorhizobium sonneratiae]MCM2293159.1 amino acid adenylation domain-containing protein [Allorhizobium sonneratiae]